MNNVQIDSLLIFRDTTMRSVHCQLFLLLFSICVPVISCFSNMLVNKIDLAKLQLRQAIQHSNEIFTQNLSFYSILDLLLLFFISLDGRERNSLLLQSK